MVYLMASLAERFKVVRGIVGDVVVFVVDNQVSLRRASLAGILEHGSVCLENQPPMFHVFMGINGKECCQWPI
jgi:hypothetical protein